MGSISDTIQELVGCAWGRKIWSKTDSSLCDQRAVKMVALHDGNESHTVVRLCDKHLAAIMDVTTPREPLGG